MAGHVFVAHADLRTFACDHWLLPVDENFSCSRSWNRTQTWRRIRTQLVGRLAGDRRVAAVTGWATIQQPWPTNVASGTRTPAAWQAESVRQFLVAASAGPAWMEGRERKLLALPIVGTGYGGKRQMAGDVLRSVMPALYAHVAAHEVDVALVAWTQEDFAAAQAARRECEGVGTTVWPAELRTELQEHARRLASLAARGRLVVFMGAGVSQGIGLPTWDELLEQLAHRAGFEPREREGLAALGPLDRAQIIGRRLGDLGVAVGRCLDVGPIYSLAHALVAGLPVREFITTNYDDCFERACHAVGRGVARLPYAPASGASRWLLKMHGCVTAPDDIVLTRQDYVRYAQRNAALAGIVQAMLITRHMLFVGFSLNDDNFHQIVDAVRRALEGADRDKLGTSVSLFGNDLVEQLWGDDLDWVHLDPRGTAQAVKADRRATARAARRFDIFLDCLSFHATAPSHLLSPRFTGVLTDRERALRTALEQLRDWMHTQRDPHAEEPVAAAWLMVENLLSDLGDES